MNKSETINNIVLSAIREFNTKGIDGARISNIAEDAGVTKQLVYHYFKGKVELYQAALDYVAGGMNLTNNIEIYDELSPLESIELIIDTIASGFSNNPGYATFVVDQLLHNNEGIGKSNQYIVSMRLFIESVFYSVLQKGIKSGVFRESLDSNITFWMIFNTVSSGFLNCYMQKSISNIDIHSPDESEAWHNAVRDFVINAISK
ncbi:AcrR family transcriptional regulator [Sphingobium fontiphilum]|uniref:AcrR family transcriptional regulator n=1 Tax=Sphingobium fontiphilum TaxID=944425 RepID=A0A7W6DN53_9SPHN|nr:TetR/AcrR family transcriptional regulator [Sphingobium fontiphilum]MBB3983670.1 AcrR family transcriptional regulator [Sphingobium fontiphilum]